MVLVMEVVQNNNSDLATQEIIEKINQIINPNSYKKFLMKQSRQLKV